MEKVGVQEKVETTRSVSLFLPKEALDLVPKIETIVPAALPLVVSKEDVPTLQKEGESRPPSPCIAESGPRQDVAVSVFSGEQDAQAQSPPFRDGFAELSVMGEATQLHLSLEEGPSFKEGVLQFAETVQEEAAESSTLLESHEVVVLAVQPAWHKRALQTIEEVGQEIGIRRSTFKCQERLDHFYAKNIQPIFNSSLIQKVDNFLTYHGDESAGVFVGKLIPRALRNVVVLAFSILKVGVRAIVHPMQTLFDLLQFVVVLAHAMTLPETYTGLGAGFIGASAGQVILAPGPQVVIGLMIGAALITFGLIFGAIKAAATAEEGHRWEAVCHQLWHQIREMPEAAMTGFFVGLILGGVEQVIDPENPIAQAANALDDLGALGSSLDNLLPPASYELQTLAASS
jgi:hypothetical protein